VRLVIATVLLACAACSSESTAPAPDAYCSTDPRVEPFDVPLDGKGATGANITIMSASPSIVQEGLNEWTVTIKDSNGNPVDGTVSVLSSMPDHGHNSPTLPVITPQGNGQYDIAQINLSMRGVWTITISIASPTITDDTTFTFCVDGSS
jgi:hypothetical protein